MGTELELEVSKKHYVQPVHGLAPYAVHNVLTLDPGTTTIYTLGFTNKNNAQVEFSFALNVE